MARTARKTRAEVSLDKTLNEIEKLNARLSELRGWLRDAREQYHGLPPERLDPIRYTNDEIARQTEVHEYILETESAIEEIEKQIQERWSLAGGLSDAPDRLPGTDEEVEGQAVELEKRMRALEATAGQRREDAADGVDAMLAAHTDRFAALVSSWPFGFGEVEEAGKLWAYQDPVFAERLHAAVDARPDADFAPGSRATWKSEIETLRNQAARRRAELELRGQEREFAAAEAAKTAAEAKLAAVGST